MKTILRRAAAFDVGVSHLTGMLAIFSRAVDIEEVHPLQGGVFRRRYRLDRRSGMPIEPIWIFYPKRAWEIASKVVRMVQALADARPDVPRGAQRSRPHRYADAALTPVADDETETLEMFTHTEAARGEVVRTRRIAELTGGRPAPAPHMPRSIDAALDHDVDEAALAARPAE